ncbi:ribosomal protein L7/L12 [Alloprevotella sp. OH1205_COT-284]|uniref:ribosomal protein L7/L12 n=1 Tax=Alloprevotella sp. OH1205_COT-284 TaxID=2491043 RepID=UPI0018F48F83|nr:ribosomal protein L7/L12 [Alloprevotella sp. OH1205_COT-284]
MKTNLLTNTFAATVALFTALFALPQTAQAQTDNDLYIAGTQVTSANCNDLSVIEGVSGTVKYDPATKTLTLDNATINAGGNNKGIESSIDGLTVKLTGTNTVTANSAAVFHTQPMTIKGSGTLNAEGTAASGIYTEETSLTIDGCTVNAKGEWGIAGNDGSSETLTIRNATVTAEGTVVSICDLRTLTLDGCKITSPTGAVWNAEKNAVCDAAGNIITDKVTIAPVSTYDLKIAGTQVTSANCNDLSVIDGVSGTMKYEHSTKTLTLDNATINAGGNNNGIFSKIDNLTVKLTGTNTVTAEYSAVFHTQPMTIKGSGTLNAESTNNPGIYTERTSLTIDGCTVNLKGKWGITGNNGDSETLTIRNATVTAEGTAGSICDLRTLTLDGCAITNPAGAVWNAEKYAVCDASGNIIKSKVTIEPQVTTYDLKIAGTQVTSANCNDLSVIDGVSGTVKYEHSTKTLTLDNATINAGGNNAGIVSSIDNLTVKLIGTNTVKVNKAAISHTLPMTIAGGGKLNTESTNNGGIFVKNTSLTIDGCTVNVKGKWGIAGNDGSSETLTIRNATVTAEGTSGSICDLRTLTLDGCKITSPAGAVWNDRKHAVCDASENIIRDKVTIEPSVSTYDVVLEAHNNNKITCIKVVRELTGIGLKEAKDLVESAPCIVLENIAKAKAEAARDKLNTAGGTANIYLHGTWKPTAIEAVTIAVPAGKRGVYNLQGVRLGDNPDRLPAGVYIYNGKKIIKK